MQRIVAAQDPDGFPTTPSVAPGIVPANATISFSVDGTSATCTLLSQGSN